MLLNEFSGSFTRAIREAASEDEGFSGKFLTLEDALFCGRTDPNLIELLNDALIGGFREEFGDAGGDFRADFADL